MAKADIDPKEAAETAKRLAEAESPPAKEEPKEEPPKEETPKAEATETAEKPEKTPEPKPEEKAEPVPEDPKEAGQAFAAMRNRIKDLEKEKEDLAAGEAAEFRPLGEELESPVPAPIGLQPDYKQYFDPKTGDFNFVKYDQDKTKQNRDETKRAVDEYRQEVETHAAYPQLDKKNKEYNPEFFAAVRGMLTDSMLHPGRGGKVISYKAAADAVINLSTKARKEVEETGAKKALEEVATKEAASLEAGGSSGRVSSAEATSELAELSERTRKGGRDGTEAAAKRLEKLGI